MNVLLRTALMLSVLCGLLLCPGCTDLTKADLIEESAGDMARLAEPGHEFEYRWPNSHKAYIFLEERVIRERIGGVLVTRALTPEGLAKYKEFAADLPILNEKP